VWCTLKIKIRLRPYQWGEGVLLSLAVPPIFTRSLCLLSDTGVGFVINSSTYAQYAFVVIFLPAQASVKIQTDIQASFRSVTWTVRLRLRMQVHRSGSKASSQYPSTGLHQPPALWKDVPCYYSSSQPLLLNVWHIIRRP